MTEVAPVTDTLTTSQHLPPVPLPNPARLVRGRKTKVLSSVMNKTTIPILQGSLIIPQQFLPQMKFLGEKKNLEKMKGNKKPSQKT